MTYTVEDGKLVPQLSPCRSCDGDGSGRHFPHVKACADCKGTGKRGRGKCQKCYTTYGDVRPGQVVDYNRPEKIKCPYCDGNGLIVPDRYDHVDAEIIAQIPVVVTPLVRRQSFAEQYIGLGLQSCTDYGASWDAYKKDPEATRAALIEKIHHISTQAVKITKPDWTLATSLIVALAPQGYSVIADYS